MGRSRKLDGNSSLKRNDKKNSAYYDDSFDNRRKSNNQKQKGKPQNKGPSESTYIDWDKL